MEQGSTEWHELRRRSIGASDAPVIMRTSPWKTPYTLWQEKMGLSPGQTVNRAMERGIAMEKEARLKLSLMLELQLRPCVLQHDTDSWMIASMDAMSFDKKIAAEIKCPGETDHQIAMGGQVPQKYYAQLQHQMVVAELEEIYYWSWSGFHGALVKIIRDDKYIRKMIELERAFVLCMENFEPPEMDGEKDYIQRGDETWNRLSGEWNFLTKQLKALGEEEKRLRQRLVDACDGRNVRGCGIAVQRTIRRGTVDYHAIPELESVDLEQYRKAPIESWRISNR